MKRVHRLVIVVLVLLFCTSCDRATKYIARESLASSPPISLLNDSVRIEYSENPGAFLSLGSHWSGKTRFLFFIVCTSVILAITIIFTINTRNLSLAQVVGLSLVASGGIGNLLDRLFNAGAVVDFVTLGIGPLRTGIFNVADVAIMAGICMTLLFRVRGKANLAGTA